MKNLLIFILLIFSLTVNAQWYYGNDEAVNLENGIGFDKNSQKIFSGVTSDPQTASISAGSGSLLLKTDGNLYAKKDNGLTTNWKKILDEATNLLTYIPTASSTQTGVLTSSDWTLFNGKEDVLTFSSPLNRIGNTISLGEVDYLDFNTATTTVAKNGRLFWDNTNNTLAFHVDAASGVIGQINEELWVEAINLTGVQINDGQVVYINETSTGFPTIALANAANYDKTIGVATQNIANGAMGKITTKGTIGGFDTSSYAAGDVLFLSDLVAGSLTNVRPASNIVQVAKVLNSQVNGKLLVDVLPPTDDQTLDPTGFLDPTLASVAYDYTTRQITLTGTYKAVWKGSPVDILNGPWTSPAHTATNGNWFLYYDGVSVVWSQTPWTFNQLMIAAVYYDGTDNSYGMVETHGVMDWRVHRNNHLTIGTFLLSGGDLSDYTLASTTPANRRPLVSTEVVLDEDVSTTIPAIASESYNQFYLSGVDTGNFAFNQTDIIPVTGSRPNYNQFTGGVWTQTPMAANAYAAVWLIAIPVTTDANSQRFRFLWVQPQSESTTLATIQALSPSSVNLNGLNTVSPEIVFTAKVIVRYVAGGTNNWTIIRAEKLVGTKISQSTVTGAFLTSVSTNATLTGDGNVATPLSVADPVTTADRNVLNSFSIVNSVTTNLNSMGFTDNRFFYFGDETMDGTIRIKQSGGALIYEKRVSGTYVEISRLDNL